MKLIVQIPCLNEEGTLPATLDDIPREIEGIDKVEILIIDDGCTDRTVEIAKERGVEHILSFPGNRGLGHAFAAGMDYCLRQGADIIVNTDGDNQYCGGDIPKLVKPIIEGRADLVIGDREPEKIAHFSFFKKKMQTIGSKVVSYLANMKVPDVASGFKAYSREAVMRITFSTDFDHTVDHVIQAGRKRIVTVNVPIGTNEKLRESRLFSNIGVFITHSISIMVRVYSSYRAMKIFTVAGLITFGIGFFIGLRFLWLWVEYGALPSQHTQSLVLAAILLLAGFQMVLTGIVADLINSSRGVLEDVSYRLRRMELENDREKKGESQ